MRKQKKKKRERETSNFSSPVHFLQFCDKKKKKKTGTLKPLSQTYASSKNSAVYSENKLPSVCCKSCLFLNFFPFLRFKPTNYWSLAGAMGSDGKTCIQMTVLLCSEGENYGDLWRMLRLSTERVHHINIYTSLWKYANPRQVIFPLFNRVIKNN